MGGIRGGEAQSAHWRVRCVLVLPFSAARCHLPGPQLHDFFKASQTQIGELAPLPLPAGAKHSVPWVSICLRWSEVVNA